MKEMSGIRLRMERVGVDFRKPNLSSLFPSFLHLLFFPNKNFKSRFFTGRS